DEGEAGQGVAAEGTAAGTGGSREGVGRRSHGSRSVGAGGKKGTRVSEVVGRRAEGGTQKERQADRSVALAGRPARRGEPGRKIPWVLRASHRGEVPCNRNRLAETRCARSGAHRSAQG